MRLYYIIILIIRFIFLLLYFIINAINFIKTKYEYTIYFHILYVFYRFDIFKFFDINF